MRKKVIVLLVFMVVLPFSVAIAAQQQDQLAHVSCHYCGMDRNKFAHSRMLVEYQDGGEVGTCSIHCMSLEFANSIDRVPKRLLVGDYNSHELIDATNAVWIIGGDQPGVMTARAKWAFAERAPAEAFVAEHGGAITTFDQAMKASYEDMYQDTLRIRKMRSMKNQKQMKQ